MNILILGSGTVEKKLIEWCLKSKHLDRIYTASSSYSQSIPNIEYDSVEDLSKKIKALQIDIVIITDKNLIQNGAVEFLKKNLINVISVNQKWFNLESSRLIAKQLLSFYSINFPNVLKAPLCFPIVIKTDLPKVTKLAYSMQELIDIKGNLLQERVFLEEYLEGEIFYQLSLWDGKNLFNLPICDNLTEVQLDRLNLYTTKLGIMLSEENADFIGFLTTKMIWAKNDWYVLDYFMRPTDYTNYDCLELDFLYVLNSAVYQKLNEI